jgi:hypothetical protein
VSLVTLLAALPASADTILVVAPRPRRCNFLIGESFSKVDSIEGGDPLVASAVLRARF